MAYGLLVGVVIPVFFEAYGDLAYLILTQFFVRAFALSTYSKHINEKIGGRLNRFLQSAGPIVGAFFWFTLDCKQNAVVLSLLDDYGLYSLNCNTGHDTDRKRRKANLLHRRSVDSHNHIFSFLPNLNSIAHTEESARVSGTMK